VLIGDDTNPNKTRIEGFFIIWRVLLRDDLYILFCLSCYRAIVRKCEKLLGVEIHVWVLS